MRTTLILLVSCLPLLSSAGEPFKVKPWRGGKGAGVKAEHLIMPVSGETFYSDRYTVEAWFEDGSRAWVSCLIQNFGLKKGTMTMKSRWHDAKDGKEHYFRTELGTGDYEVAASPFSAEGASHRLWGTPWSFHVRGGKSERRFELTFKSGLPPFRPGSGRTSFDEIGEKYYDHTRVQTKAVVTGSVSIAGAKKKLTGYGYVTHTIATIAPHEQYKHYLQVRSIDTDTVVYIDHFKTPPAYGSVSVGYVYVARGGKVVATSTSARLELGGWQRDEKHPNKYKIPFKINAVLKRKGTVTKVAVVAEKILERDDMLADENKLKAALIRQYAQPVEYRIAAKVHVSVQEGDAEPVVTTADAIYELNHLNK